MCNNSRIYRILLSLLLYEQQQIKKRTKKDIPITRDKHLSFVKISFVFIIARE